MLYWLERDYFLDGILVNMTFKLISLSILSERKITTISFISQNQSLMKILNENSFFFPYDALPSVVAGKLFLFCHKSTEEKMNMN